MTYALRVHGIFCRVGTYHEVFSSICDHLPSTGGIAHIYTCPDGTVEPQEVDRLHTMRDKRVARTNQVEVKVFNVVG